MRAAFSVFVLAWCAALSAAVPQQAAPANETPGQFYQRYRATVPAATKVEEIVAFWTADQRAEYGAAAPADRMGLDEIKAAFQMVTAVKVLKESSSGNTATVEAEAAMDGKPVRATIQLAREKDGWKVASGPEHWR